MLRLQFLFIDGQIGGRPFFKDFANLADLAAHIVAGHVHFPRIVGQGLGAAVERQFVELHIVETDGAGLEQGSAQNKRGQNRDCAADQPAHGGRPHHWLALR